MHGTTSPGSEAGGGADIGAGTGTEGWQLEPAAPVAAGGHGGFADELEALLQTAQHADDHLPLSDHQRRALRVQAEPLVAVAARRHGQLVGYSQAVRDRDTWSAELVVHPAHRAGSLPADLLGATVAAVARRGGGHLTLWLFKASAAADHVARSCGLRPTREVHQMRRPLPAPAELGSRVAVTPLRPGVDDAAWVALNNRAFAGHPEQGAWTADDLNARMAEPWFDAKGFLLHHRDGRLAGWCWTKVHGDHQPPLGEIYVIGVDPDFQGLGLGRGLVLAGLDHLAGVGLAHAMLYVDGDNASAIGLYRALGFTDDHVDRAYEGRVDRAYEGRVDRADEGRVDRADEGRVDRADEGRVDRADD